MNSVLAKFVEMISTAPFETGVKSDTFINVRIHAACNRD